jgi:uncharacterized membrane protein
MKHLVRFSLVLFAVLISAMPVAAQDVGGQVESFFASVEGIMMAIAASASVIGFIGLGILYVLGHMPVVSTWKQKNPDAASQVTMGLIILIFVGSGAMAGMLSF